MCGRIAQKSNPQRLGLGLTTVDLIEPLQAPARFNGAPGQDHWVIRQNPKTGGAAALVIRLRRYSLSSFWQLDPGNKCRDDHRTHHQIHYSSLLCEQRRRRRHGWFYRRPGGLLADEGRSGRVT